MTNSTRNNLNEAGGYLRAAEGKLKFEEKRLFSRREVRTESLKAALVDLHEATELIEDKRRGVIVLLAEIEECPTIAKVGKLIVEVVSGRKSDALKALEAERMAASV